METPKRRPMRTLLTRGRAQVAVARRAFEGAATQRARRAAVRRTMRMALVLGASAVLLLASPLTGTARANGVPTLVNLSYIDLSNWGSEEATGTAELLFAEGLVRLEIDGLPQLVNERYQGWLVNSEVGDAISIGRFNADATDTVSYAGVLPPIADFGFDLLIVTVEPEPDDAPQPTAERSVGGYFVLVGQPDADATGNDSSSATDSSIPSTAPPELPATGDFTLQSDIVRVGLLVAVMGLSVFVGLRLGRRPA